MSKLTKRALVANQNDKPERRKLTSIVFKRKKGSRSSSLGATNSKPRSGDGEPSKKPRTFRDMRPREAAEPINQRYIQIQEQDGFARYDPVRPSNKHRAEERYGDNTWKEIDALGDLLMASTCSIARRTPYPQALLWPIVSALAHLIDEYLDETSEFEMGEINGALLDLELRSGGKVQFARQGRPRQ